VIFPLPWAGHHLEGLPSAVEDPVELDVDDLVPVRRAELVHRLGVRVRDARVVEQDVEMSEFRDGRRELDPEAAACAGSHRNSVDGVISSSSGLW
jgi:hypothetical protein